MKIATRTFTFTDAYGSGEVTKGERIADDHELVKMFPDAWRNFTLDDELKIRSTRVAELREAAERPAGRAPVSRAGREERKQEDFWRSVDRMLHPDDGRTSEERREQAVFDDGLRQIERLDEARLAEETDGLREMWAGRLPAE
jgi:hypothetical protein